MSKTVHTLNLPVITTQNNITPWKEALESIGFVVDLTTYTDYANWGNTPYGIKLQSNAIYVCYNGRSNVNTYVPIISNLQNLQSVVFSYFKYGDAGLLFNIQIAGQSPVIKYGFISPSKEGEHWFGFAQGYWMAGTVNKSTPTNVQAVTNIQINDNSVVVVPMWDNDRYRDDYFLAVSHGFANDFGLYEVEIDNTTYLCIKPDGITTFSNTRALHALPLDHIWDDADY